MKRWRVALPAVLLALSALTVAACGGGGESSTAAGSGSGGGGGGGQMTFTTWGGALQEGQQKAFALPFQQQDNVKVNLATPVDYAKLKSMVQTNNVVWDVVDVESYISRRGCEEGWLEKLDFSVIKRDAFLASMPTTACSVPTGSFPVAMAYRTDKFPDAHPQTWAEFFDTKRFPGKRSFPKYAAGSGVLEAALLADGVPKDKLYPLDVDRALRKLDSIKKDIVWWTSGDQSEQLMQSGEVTLCACWSTRMYDLKVNQDSPVAIEWKDHVLGWDDFVIPKGAPNRAAAMRFIAYATQPASQIKLTETTPWGPSTTEAAAKPSPATAAWVPTTPEHLKLGVPIDYGWWAKNATEMDTKFAQWLLQ
jgi:putative spermidine/putrescine transport system substrate-binding protein